MLKHLPLKQNYLLILISVIMALAAYRFAVKHTIDAWKTNKQLKSQINGQNNVADQPDYLERKNSNLDKILKLYRADSLTYRSEAITTISFIAAKYNVHLTGAPVRDNTYQSEKYNLQKLSFAGDYFSLIKLLQQLEVTDKIGKVRSFILKAPGKKETYVQETTAEAIFEIAVN